MSAAGLALRRTAELERIGADGGQRAGQDRRTLYLSGGLRYRAGTGARNEFKNSSVIDRFHHWVFDGQGHLIGQEQGGIHSREANPFFLRHAREMTLAPGHYRLITEAASPFFLAQPLPYLDTLEHYRQTIKAGNALTMLCLGVLLALAFYYAALAISRRNATDALYCLFFWAICCITAPRCWCTRICSACIGFI